MIATNLITFRRTDPDPPHHSEYLKDAGPKDATTINLINNSLPANRSKQQTNYSRPVSNQATDPIANQPAASNLNGRTSNLNQAVSNPNQEANNANRSAADPAGPANSATSNPAAPVNGNPIICAPAGQPIRNEASNSPTEPDDLKAFDLDKDDPEVFMDAFEQRYNGRDKKEKFKVLLKYLPDKVKRFVVGKMSRPGTWFSFVESFLHRYGDRYLNLVEKLENEMFNQGGSLGSVTICFQFCSLSAFNR